MDDSNSNSNSLTNAIKGLRKFDGRDPSHVRDWHKKFVVLLGVTRRDIASLINGRIRPSENTAHTETLEQDIASFNRANEDLYAMLFLLTEKPASLLVLKHENHSGTSGDGQKALQELVAKYNKVTDEVVLAAMEKLVNTSMNPGQDPDDFFIEKTLARAELAKMDEPITDRRFKDICVQGFTSDYKDIKLMMYRDPSFDIDQMQSTMRHLYLDDLSRSSGAKGKIAGRGVAMAAETSTCDYCGKEDHVHNCWQKRDETRNSGAHDRKPKNKKYSGGKTGGAKGAAGQKLCSVHKTTSHCDEGCYEQGAPRPERKGAHLASTVLSAGPSPVNDDEKQYLQFDDDFDQGYAFSGRTTESARGISVPNPDMFTMLVDSGASDHFVDAELIPGLRQGMAEYQKLDQPKPIETAGNMKVFGTATGKICGHIINKSGQPIPARMSVLIVPGMGRHLFSSARAMRSRVSTILETGNPHLQFDNTTSFLLNQPQKDEGMCSLEVSLRALDGVTYGSSKTPSTPAVAPAVHVNADIKGDEYTSNEFQEPCVDSSITMEFTATVTPQNGVSEQDGLTLAATCMLKDSNDTPEEATAAETERQRAHVQDRLHKNAGDRLEEDKSSTTAGAPSPGAGVSSPGAGASSPGVLASSTGAGDFSSGIGKSSSEAGNLPQEAGVPSSGVAAAASPGATPSTSGEVTSDVPHQETASTRLNPSVEETFDSTHAKGTSGENLPATCVEFSYTDRDPFWASEEDNRVMKIPNKLPRCHSLPGAALHGTVSTGITGAASPGIIRASPPGITEAASPGIIRASSLGITGASPSGVAGLSLLGGDGLTPPASPGIVSTIREPRLTRISTRAEPKTETGHQLKGVHPHAHDSGRTTAGKPGDRICGINAGRPRAAGDFDGVRVHLQANLSLPLLPERRAHHHRDQDAETDCIINSIGAELQHELAPQVRS